MKVGIFGTMMKSEDRVKKIISILEKNKIKVCYINEKGLDNPNIMKKISHSLINGIKFFWVFIKADILYITPGSQNIIKVVIARLFKKKIICDFYFSLYDTAVNDRKRCNSTSLKGVVYKYRDRFSLKYSNLVLFLNEAEAIHYCDSVNMNIKCVNYKILTLCREKKEAAQLNFYEKPNQKLSLCWTGTYIPLHGLDKIIEATRLLIERNINFILYLIGPNSKKREEYKRMICDLKMEKYVEFIDLWGNTNLWEEFIHKNCDITLGIFGDSKKAKSVVANKVIDGVSFKTPVITAKSKGISNYFNGIDDIYVVENNPEKIANKIVEVSKMDFSVVSKNIDNAYKVYECNFSEGHFEKEILALLKNL